MAPRPFPEEPLGGWLGRVAARYRMSIEQLALQGGLDAVILASDVGWLLMPPQRMDVLVRLAALARLDVRQLEPLQTPSEWVFDRSGLLYCPRCLFLNPIDVSVPRWLRQWLDPWAACCKEHKAALHYVGRPALQRCHNFDDVLRVIGRLEDEQRWRERAARHKANGPQWLREP
nr:TniQ family protein [Caldimonas tepidiphila]